MARSQPQSPENAVKPELSKLELDVMDIVWGLGECTSAEVIEAFREKRDLAETTIRTVLTNIRKKGYLELVPTVERVHRVRPTVSRSEVGRRTLKGLVAGLFGGSPSIAVQHLLKAEKIDDAELEEIERLIQEHKRRARGGPKS